VSQSYAFHKAARWHTAKSISCLVFVIGHLVLCPATQGEWHRVDAPELQTITPYSPVLHNWRDSLWLVTSCRGILSSNDGERWRGPFSSEVWGCWFERVSYIHNDDLYVVGASSQYNAINSSADGTEWARVGYVPCGCPTYRRGAVALSFDGRVWVLGGSFQVEEPEGAIDSEPKQEYEAEYVENLLNTVASSPNGATAWSTTEAQWPARHMHAGVVFQDKLWVLGGEAQTPSGQQYMNDVWHSSDGESWVQATGAAAWAPRVGLASIVYRNKIWVLGGYTETGDKNDVWCSTDGATWTQVEESAPWPARRFLACTVFQDKVWVIGGSSGWDTLCDVWTYYEGEGEGAAEGEGEGTPVDHYHTADQNQNQRVDLSELLRVIQFYNLGDFRCAIPPESTEDGYAPGVGDTSCARHDSDYAPRDWRIGLSELLRLIQFFNTGGYRYCPESGSEDGFCPAG